MSPRRLVAVQNRRSPFGLLAVLARLCPRDRGSTSAIMRPGPLAAATAAVVLLAIAHLAMVGRGVHSSSLELVFGFDLKTAKPSSKLHPLLNKSERQGDCSHCRTRGFGAAAAAAGPADARTLADAGPPCPAAVDRQPAGHSNGTSVGERLWEYDPFLPPRWLRQGVFSLGNLSRMRRFTQKLLSGGWLAAACLLCLPACRWGECGVPLASAESTAAHPNQSAAHLGHACSPARPPARLPACMQASLYPCLPLAAL